jgi:hypothetical protein
MQQIPRFQLRGPVRQPFFVNKERKIDARLFSKGLRKMKISQPNGSQVGPGIPDSALMFAQLRDVLAAEDSAVMPQEYEYRRPVLP